jgi:hypothetical protein
MLETEEADHPKLHRLAESLLHDTGPGEGPSVIHLVAGVWSPILPLVLAALSSHFNISLQHVFLPLLPTNGWEPPLLTGKDGALISIKSGPDQIASGNMPSITIPEKNCRAGVLILNGARAWERSFGYPLDVLELRAALEGKGPLALTKLTMEIGAEILVRGNVCPSLREARFLIREALLSGHVSSAFADKAAGLKEFSPVALKDSLSLHQKTTLFSPRKGFLSSIDTAGIHRAIQAAGLEGGSICLRLLKSEGDSVEKNSSLADFFSVGMDAFEREKETISRMFRIAPVSPPHLPLILQRMELTSSL